jgi:putative salt-induced outer membrane protein YdiY
VVSARSVTGVFRASRQLRERLSFYGQYDYLRDVFAGVEQRHVAEAGVSFRAVDRGRQRLRLDGGAGYLHEQGPDDELNTATLSAAASYRFLISETSEFKYEPRYLLTLSDTGAWKFDQEAALAVAINSVLALKVSHIIRYSADPPVGFESTDTIMGVSLVAKIKRP